MTRRMWVEGLEIGPSGAPGPGHCLVGAGVRPGVPEPLPTDHERLCSWCDPVMVENTIKLVQNLYGQCYTSPVFSFTLSLTSLA